MVFFAISLINSIIQEQKWRKTEIFLILFEPILISITEDDKKKRNMVIKDIVASIDRKAKMDQEFKSGCQGHTIFFSKM